VREGGEGGLTAPQEPQDLEPSDATPHLGQLESCILVLS
jgi:hypothetical protein